MDMVLAAKANKLDKDWRLEAILRNTLKKRTSLMPLIPRTTPLARGNINLSITPNATRILLFSSL